MVICSEGVKRTKSWAASGLKRFKSEGVFFSEGVKGGVKLCQSGADKGDKMV